MEEWCTSVKAPSDGHHVSKGKGLLWSRLPADPPPPPPQQALLRASVPFISGGTDAYKLKRRKSLTDRAASGSVWHCEV